MSYYRRHLPHWQPRHRAVYITCRLHGSRPKCADGPHWLARPDVAQIVIEGIDYGSKRLERYHVYAYVVMSNHVHLLIEPWTEIALITKTLKGFTARRAN